MEATGITKTCSKCGEIKPTSCFPKNKGCKNGLDPRCKSCVKAYSAEWYKLNREKCLKHSKEWYAANSERKAATVKKWCAENIERRKENAVVYRRSHMDEYRDYARKQRVLNPEMSRAAARRYKAKHPDLGKITARIYRDRHPLISRVRNHVCNTIRRLTDAPPKRQRTIKYLGCSWSDYEAYIRSKFKDGMTWDLLKSGAIHIDHIRPLSWFNLTNESERLAAFHFSNTQPMWAKENLIKGNRWAG